MNRSCDSLTDEQIYKLAHDMTNCFLSGSGFPTYRCTAAMSARECAASMGPDNDRAFTTYNSMYANIHRWALVDGR